MGINKKQEGKHVIYARVSNHGQRDDLRNQWSFCQLIPTAEALLLMKSLRISVVGLTTDVKNEGKVKTIYITNQDRFIRFGFIWFQSFVKKLGANIVVVNQEELSAQEEMVQDLISIIHVFSCRVYGLRKYKNRIREDKNL